MSRVTIKTIARDLGISHMTVSRALSDSANVSGETRDAVQRRARDLGYVRNAAALAMRGAGPGVVGLLLPNITNEFYARFANTMALACDARSLQLIIHLTNDNVAAEARALARLREVQAGVVVMVPAPGEVGPGEVEPGAPDMPVIELIRQRTSLGRGPAVLVDDVPAIGAAIRHLASAGHRQIGYIGANPALSSGRMRLDAVIAAARDAGIALPVGLVRTGAPSFQMGHRQARALVEAGAATAILCGGVEISNGALSALMDSGAAAADVAFIGYGDPSFYAWINGGITTIRVPVEQLAEGAAQMIAALLPGPGGAGAAGGLAAICLAAELVIR